MATPKTPTKKDRVRWYLIRKGYSADNIAAEQKCSILEVHESVQRVVAYQAEVSNEAVEMKVNEVVLRGLDKAGKVIEGAMGATNVSRVVVGDKVKKFTSPDHAMRLKGVESLKNLMETNKPKTPLVSNTNNTQINTTRPTDANGRPMSFEERIRQQREVKGIDDETDIVDGEVVEPTSAQEELEELGIDLEADDGDPAED